jgi:hypothetical protein
MNMKTEKSLVFGRVERLRTVPVEIVPGRIKKARSDWQRQGRI